MTTIFNRLKEAIQIIFGHHNSCLTTPNPEEPLVVFLFVDGSQELQIQPVTANVYAGQNLTYYASSAFTIYFILRNPEDPQVPKEKGQTFYKFESEQQAENVFSCNICVADEYRKGSIIKMDPLTVTDKNVQDLFEEQFQRRVKFVHKIHSRDKTPIDTEKTLQVKYMIEINERMYDPSARIIKK